MPPHPYRDTRLNRLAPGRLENCAREPTACPYPDAFLAAAAAGGLAIVIRNQAEFRNTGVETVDPRTGRQS